MQLSHPPSRVGPGWNGGVFGGSFGDKKARGFDVGLGATSAYLYKKNINKYWQPAKGGGGEVVWTPFICLAGCSPKLAHKSPLIFDWSFEHGFFLANFNPW
jgi:hypothetical protein